MSKNLFISLLFLSLLVFSSTLVSTAQVSDKTNEVLPTSLHQGVHCGDIFAKPQALKQNFQHCRYELDQFKEVQSNLETIKNQLNDCPTHECFLEWGEILDHVRGEILSNLTLIERSFELSKETRLEWGQEWEKIDKEEEKVRRDAYNKGLQRQRATHENDYLLLE